jgi:hypothetical protein
MRPVIDEFVGRYDDPALRRRPRRHPPRTTTSGVCAQLAAPRDDGMLTRIPDRRVVLMTGAADGSAGGGAVARLARR